MGATGGQLLMLAEDTEVDIKVQESLVTVAKAVHGHIYKITYCHIFHLKNFYGNHLHTYRSILHD